MHAVESVLVVFLLTTTLGIVDEIPALNSVFTFLNANSQFLFILVVRAQDNRIPACG